MITFFRLGLFCATYPIFVILASLLACGALTAGVYNFQVLTDPVELWSPFDSVTRINKDYYDTHFRPFYRTTQMIVRPTNTTPWVHTIFGQNDVQYAATLELEFLAQVLRLQLSVSSLQARIDDGTNRTVTLNDICFAPLSPDNTNCTVQSALNFWQNDEARLRTVVLDPDFGIPTADHITHFQSCVSSPSNQNDTIGFGCMADFGGIVMPYLALGGYPTVKRSPQYGNASALVITYIINNHKDAQKNEPAMAWEKEVIEFLKNFSNPNMTVSFSTERSIQDELDRESRSDVYTILISYMAMFMYITLTLGNFRVLGSKHRLDESDQQHRYESSGVIKTNTFFSFLGIFNF